MTTLRDKVKKQIETADTKVTKPKKKNAPVKRTMYSTHVDKLVKKHGLNKAAADDINRLVAYVAGHAAANAPTFRG